MAKRTHGRSRTPMYSVWRSMLNRCYCPTQSMYYRYGARGIVVCERWLKFENFLADMGERPDGLSIDRIDNSGDYEPGNCRWATPSTQGKNRISTRLLTHQGETLCMTDWSKRAGLAPSAIHKRLAKGWSVALAVTAPATPLADRARCRRLKEAA